MSDTNTNSLENPTIPEVEIPIKTETEVEIPIKTEGQIPIETEDFSLKKELIDSNEAFGELSLLLEAMDINVSKSTINKKSQYKISSKKENFYQVIVNYGFKTGIKKNPLMHQEVPKLYI